MKRDYQSYQENNTQKKKRTLKRKDRDEEDLIEKGGSSQDKFESDFIDDDMGSGSDGEFKVENVKNKMNEKHDDGLPDEEEDEPEYMTDQSEDKSKKPANTKQQAPAAKIEQSDDSEESEGEIYDKLQPDT